MHFSRIDRISDRLYAELVGLEGVTVFHSAPWHRLLRQVFAWQVHAIVGHDDNGQLLFFLPFVAKRRLGRRINVCLPLSHSIGPAYHRTLDLAQIAVKDLLWPVEIHANVPLQGAVHTAHHLVTLLTLSSFPDQLALLKSFHSAKRRKIAAAEREGVRVFLASSAADYDKFRELQSHTRHRQGAPDYPASFFPTVFSELASADIARLYLADVDGVIAAGVIVLRHHDTVLYAYGASLGQDALLRKGVNQAVMWGAIKDAWADGYRVFDFGSTPAGQSELLRYKEQFGGGSCELVHTFGSPSGVPLDTPQDGVLAQLGGAVLRRMPLRLFSQLSPLLLRAVV